MNKDEILIIRPQFPIKADAMIDIHKRLIEQMKTGVVLLPFGYDVVVAPKDVEVKIDTKPEQPKNNHGIERMTFGSR